MAKSLLFQSGTDLLPPPDCGPGRQEAVAKLRKNGRFYTFIVRDRAVVEDPYLVQVKAAAFATKTGEPYMGRVVTRDIRDVFIKNSVTI